MLHFDGQDTNLFSQMTQPVISFDSVSYTHLDVYKRQVDGRICVAILDVASASRRGGQSGSGNNNRLISRIGDRDDLIVLLVTHDLSLIHI